MCADRGFTLLELLVALVIAGLALGVLFRGISGSYGAVAAADGYEQALARARSRLAMVGSGVALAPLHQNGDDGHGYRWQVDIALAGSAAPLRQPADAAHGPAPRMALYDVAVTESWDGDHGPRQVRLRTERIGILP
jgi:general secretion pathway protein I